MIKTLIIDGERPARAELRDLLRAHPEIEIIGEAGNAAEARALMAQLHPALIFLDVQMPAETGFDLLGSLGENAPRAVFTTAHDGHAPRAFALGAKDCLLKPVSPARLATAIRRLVPDFDDANDDAPPENATAPAAPPDAGATLDPADRILVGEGGNLALVTVESIRCAESIGAHSMLWLEKGASVVARPLESLEARLPSSLFFRANRAQLINLRHVIAAEPCFGDSLLVVLDNGKKIGLARPRARIFRESRGLFTQPMRPRPEKNHPAAEPALTTPAGVPRFVRLNHLEPMARGGHRLVYAHPHAPALVLKVPRPDARYENRGNLPFWRKHWQRFKHYNDSVREAIEHAAAYADHEQLPPFMQRFYGFVETDLGLASVSKAERDRRGDYALNLAQLVERGLFDDTARAAFEEFARQLLASDVVVGDLRMENLVYSHDPDGDRMKIVIIDGIGDKNGVKICSWSKLYNKISKRKRLRKLRALLDAKLALIPPGATGLQPA